MKLANSNLALSATDLGNHLACRHLTSLDLAAAYGHLQRPMWRDKDLEVLQERGFRHERAYLNHLESLGRRVVSVEAPADDGHESAFAATRAAMLRGEDVIVQPTLEHAPWRGRADVLLRVRTPSALGDWSYEVVDTKLAHTTRAGTILQLCLYSHVVNEIQGVWPARMHVVAPSDDFAPYSFRVLDYLAYFRLIGARLRTAVADPAIAATVTTYPEPVPHCEICRWGQTCKDVWRRDDHLTFVASISRLQRRQLADWGVTTLGGLAVAQLPLERRPLRGTRAGYQRVQRQANIQFNSRGLPEALVELLPLEAGRGLARLPEPSPGDVFFDLEGDRFADGGPLEYLFGWATIDASEGPADLPDGGRARTEYFRRWSLHRTDERAAFEEFVDFVMDRWRHWPGMHIYHYAPYEPSALKRLMGRYASREDEIDRMLRAGLLVDLYAVVKQSLIAGIEQYSIKSLEPFYQFERGVELRSASKALHLIEWAIELGETDVVSPDAQRQVELYNRDDCISTRHLRDWLELHRRRRVSDGFMIDRPVASDGEPTEELSEQQQTNRDLRDKLLAGVPDEAIERTAEQRARWLLAHLLDWHWRELKVAFWEGYRLSELDEDDLRDEKAGLVGLQFVQAVDGPGKTAIHRYKFDEQDTAVDVDDELFISGGHRVGDVVGIDLAARSIDIKKQKATTDLHPTAVYTHTVFKTREQQDSLRRLGQSVIERGIDGEGPYGAARDLLLARNPRLTTGEHGALRLDIETPQEAAHRVVLELDESTLAVQGPPGSGKTYAGARMICELVRAGKKVGITSNSHKVIRNLVDATLSAASNENMMIACVVKSGDEPKAIADEEGKGSPHALAGGTVTEVKANAAVLGALVDGDAQVAAGTAWLWSREEFFESVDVLFVDEAGQISLANVLAVAQAAKSVVLLGDPQQLQQPQQGSHPEGTDVSALDHLLDGSKTIDAERGLFLDETWRLHPSICAFTSEMFYDDRLSARAGCERQALTGSRFAGEGLWFVPVEHEGNQSESAEEAAAVRDLMAELTSPGSSWIDSQGTSRPMTPDDVLIVAPYNAQVGALQRVLPNAQIGTVDKFQGQEAPVVIYTMATSSPEDAPRGMEFLYNLNRLNVATSRARCACIVVASPALLEPDCRTPRQMQLANALCRFAELARA